MQKTFDASLMAIRQISGFGEFICYDLLLLMEGGYTLYNRTDKTTALRRHMSKRAGKMVYIYPEFCCYPAMRLHLSIIIKPMNMARACYVQSLMQCPDQALVYSISAKGQAHFLGFAWLTAAI